MVSPCAPPCRADMKCNVKGRRKRGHGIQRGSREHKRGEETRYRRKQVPDAFQNEGSQLVAAMNVIEPKHQ